MLTSEMLTPGAFLSHSPPFVVVVEERHHPEPGTCQFWNLAKLAGL